MIALSRNGLPINSNKMFTNCSLLTIFVRCLWSKSKNCRMKKFSA